MISIPVRVLLVSAVVLLLAGTSGCSRKGSELRKSVSGVLIVTLSEKSEVPPDCEALQLEKVDFRPVSTEVLPSATSALTGLLPPEHGLRTDGVGAISPDTETIATRLAKSGYECAAFVSDVALSPEHGLTNGFSLYSVMLQRGADGSLRRFRASSESVCKAAVAWLGSRKNPSRPVCLWLHLSPAGGLAPTWSGVAGSTEASAAAADGVSGLSEVVRAFDSKSKVVVVPLFEAAADSSGARSFASPSTGGVPAFSTGFRRGVKSPNGEQIGVADVPWLLGCAPELRPAYWESIVPWYAFRLPPLAVASEKTPSPLNGLTSEPKPMILGSQSEMAMLRTAGHLGEGLIPPLPEGTGFSSSLSPETETRIDDWRTAISSTNKVEAAKSLVQRYADVPLFQDMLGMSLVQAGEVGLAANAFALETQIGYNMIHANRMLSRCHAALGNVPAAIDRAEAAFLAGASDPVTRHELAMLLLETGAAMANAGETRSARDCIDRVLLLEPSNPVARLESAKLLLRTAQTNDAKRTLRALLRETPAFAPASALLNQLDP